MKTFTKVVLVIIFLFTAFQSKAQWTQTAFDSNQVFMLKRANGKLFTYSYSFKTYQGGLYVSTDSGSTWNSADSLGAFTQLYVYDMTYDSAHSDYVLVANGQDGVYYSSDGYSWTNSGTNWNGEGIVYIHNQDVLSNTGAGAAISTDGGKSWNSSITGLTYPYYAHSLVRVHDTLFIALQGTVCFISTNYGASWTAEVNNMDYFIDCFFEHKNIVYGGLYIAGVAYFQDGTWGYDTTGLTLSTDTWALADAGDTLFCGGDNGVWMNYSGRWQDFSCELPENHPVLKLLHVGHYLFAGTDTGLYEMDLHNSNCNTAAIAQVAADNTVKVFPTITDDFVSIYSATIPHKIEVINVNGQVVQVDNSQTKIDVRKLPSGIYFLRITMNDGEVFSDKIAKQ